MNNKSSNTVSAETHTTGGRVEELHPPVTDGEETDVMNVLEIRDREIDVGAIMEQIRSSIRAKREAGVLRDEAWLTHRLDASNLPGSARRNTDRVALIQMAGRLNLAGDPLKSHRPVIGSFIVGFKRFTRFWIRKYTDQVFTRQIHYNTEVLHMLAELQRDNEQLRDRVHNLESTMNIAHEDSTEKRSTGVGN